MDRSNFLASALALVSAPPALATMQLAGVTIPVSDLAKDAEAIAKAAVPAEIFNHSLRSYLFAELIANAKNIDHDREIVYVASILHDVGMSAARMSDEPPFEVDGADAARPGDPPRQPDLPRLRPGDDGRQSLIGLIGRQPGIKQPPRSVLEHAGYRTLTFLSRVLCLDRRDQGAVLAPRQRRRIDH